MLPIRYGEWRAAELRARALAEAPATSGSVNGEPFEWIADADSRLGPVIEVIVNGAYYWAPIQRIRAIEIEEPTDLRDMVWTAGYFTWSNGGQSVGLIPTRYPGSESHAEGQVRMARQTVQAQAAGDLRVGLGELPAHLPDVTQLAVVVAEHAGIHRRDLVSRWR